MTIKILDAQGVSHLWKKIKAYIDTKGTSSGSGPNEYYYSLAEPQDDVVNIGQQFDGDYRPGDIVELDVGDNDYCMLRVIDTQNEDNNIAGLQGTVMYAFGNDKSGALWLWVFGLEEGEAKRFRIATSADLAQLSADRHKGLAFDITEQADGSYKTDGYFNSRYQKLSPGDKVQLIAHPASEPGSVSGFTDHVVIECPEGALVLFRSLPGTGYCITTLTVVDNLVTHDIVPSGLAGWQRQTNETIENLAGMVKQCIDRLT